MEQNFSDAHAHDEFEIYKNRVGCDAINKA